MDQELAGGLRTADMALAAYLSVAGHDFVLDRDEDDPDRGYWCFAPSHALTKDEQSFRCKAARVEPRRYQRELTHVRREMVDFIHGR